MLPFGRLAVKGKGDKAMGIGRDFLLLFARLVPFYLAMLVDLPKRAVCKPSEDPHGVGGIYTLVPGNRAEFFSHY